MSDTMDSIVGKNVQLLRGARSQQAIADEMRARGWKWSQATLWAIEKGERPLRLAEAVSLAEVLRCNVARLTQAPVREQARWHLNKLMAEADKERMDAANDLMRLERTSRRALRMLDGIEAHGAILSAEAIQGYRDAFAGEFTLDAVLKDVSDRIVDQLADEIGRADQYAPERIMDTLAMMGIVPATDGDSDGLDQEAP